MVARDTELKRKGLRSPYVDISVSNYGNVTAHVLAYRDKPRGGTEEVSLFFEGMDGSQLACIAGSAIRALRRLRTVQDERIVESIEFATGWSEGDGPRGASD